MTSVQQRHGDIVIQRRFGQHSSTHAVKQIYAVTYPAHGDEGTERQSYEEAEQSALKLARDTDSFTLIWPNRGSGRKPLMPWL